MQEKREEHGSNVKLSPFWLLRTLLYKFIMEHEIFGDMVFHTLRDLNIYMQRGVTDIEEVLETMKLAILWPSWWRIVSQG